MPPCLVGIEACSTAHYWAREITALGHQVRLVVISMVGGTFQLVALNGYEFGTRCRTRDVDRISFEQTVRRLLAKRAS